MGMRFQNIAIPAGATISSATIQFQVDEATSGTIELFITGQAADNAQTFDQCKQQHCGQTDDGCRGSLVAT